MIMFLDPFVTVLSAPPVPAPAVRWARLVIFRGVRLHEAENLSGTVKLPPRRLKSRLARILSRVFLTAVTGLAILS